MKKTISFIVGVLCGALVFGGGMALANSGVLATLTRQIFYYNGDQISLEAYAIDGYNYVRLRDAAALFGVNVDYDETTNTVYLGEKPKTSEPKIADGNAYAREDFSAQANPAIFDDVYTRDAYNAIRQSLVDRDLIIAGNNSDGYNADYDYAHFVDLKQTINSPGETYRAVNAVLGAMNGHYFYLMGHEPELRDYYKYPGYAIIKPTVHDFFAEANKATDSFITSLSGLSDRDKVYRICDYISDRLYFDVNYPANFNYIFTSTEPIGGNCGTYSTAFIYLGQRAGLNCLAVQDNEHGWNEVYVDGKWELVDVSSYDAGRSNTFVFATYYPRTDISPKKTQFVKELLVPGSTK